MSNMTLKVLLINEGSYQLSEEASPPEETNLLKASQPKSNRRPYIDVIRVGLTWGILLFHTVLIYVPWHSYYVKDPFYDFVNNTAPGARVSTIFRCTYAPL